MDIAALGISIETSSIVSANQKLDQLENKADAAAKGTGRLRKSFSDFKSGFMSGFWGEFARGAGEGARGVDSLDKSMNRAKTTGVGFSGIMQSLIPTISVASVAYALKSIVNYIDETAKSAQKIGFAADEFSKFSYAVDISDVGVARFQTNVSTLNDRLSDLSAGKTNEATRALKALGVSAVDSAGNLRSTKDIILDVADRFSKYADGINKSAMAQGIFGRSGREMIPFLNQGRDAILELTDKAEFLGVVIGDQLAKDADTFNDRLTDMQYYIKGVAVTAAGSFLPALNDLGDAFFQTLPSAKSLGEYLGEEFKGILITASAYIKTTAQEVRALGFVFDAIGGNTSWSDAMANIREDAAKTRVEIDELYKIGDGKRSQPLKGISTEGNNLPQAPTYNFKAPSKPKRVKADPDISEAKRLFESLMTPMEAYKKKQQEVSRLLKEGHITQETYNRAVGDAQAQYVEAEGALKTLAVSQQDLLSNVDHYSDAVEASRDITKGFFSDLRSGIKEGEGLWSSLKNSALNALSSIADRMFNFGIDSIFDGLSASKPHPLYGGGGGLLESFLNFLPSFDVGTNRVPRNMLANVHEGEMIIPKFDAEKIRSGASLANSQKPTVVFQVNNYSDAEVRQRPDGSGIDIVSAISNVIASGGADKAMRSRFNVAPGKVIRG